MISKLIADRYLNGRIAIGEADCESFTNLSTRLVDASRGSIDGPTKRLSLARPPRM